ncbi:MAG: hypothetical protein J0L92_24005 [Deltaproteobacteria bacterium]|nr:hypothetical protein [Deltaproteobacteria bacterium]
MRGARLVGLLGAVALSGCDPQTQPEDGGGIDAPLSTDASADVTPDARALDASGLDVAVVDAFDLDAVGPDAPGLDAAVDAPPTEHDALGLDALGLDALGTDAGGDAAVADANDDAGSRFDRCTAGCDYLLSCGLSGCASFGIDCASVDEERACIVDCLRGYACSDVSGIGFSSCSAACRTPIDAAYPDVFASDARADSGSLSDRCSAGCDYLLGCGFSTCSTLGVDCAMPMESHACLADCLRGFACIDVPGVGFTYCQDQCAGTLDAGPPNDAGPGPLACTTCAMSSCGSELTDCLADDTCEALALCVSTCADTACRDDCLTRHPAMPALRDPVLSCLCTRCASPCAEVDPCAIP